MKTSFDAFSYAGKTVENQDRVLAKKIGDTTLLGVADGMGGHSAGAKASQLVIDSVVDFFSGVTGQLDEAVMEKCFLYARNKVLDYASEKPEERDLGTTLSLIAITRERLVFGHSGDSRLYHLRDNGIVALTQDQTELQYLIDAGIVSKHKARSYKRKNILLSAISPSVDFAGKFDSVEIKVGDRFVAITDGGYDNISKREIRDLSLKSETIDVLSSKVLETIQSGVIKDDYSAAFLEVL